MTFAVGTLRAAFMGGYSHFELLSVDILATCAMQIQALSMRIPLDTGIDSPAAVGRGLTHVRGVDAAGHFYCHVVNSIDSALRTLETGSSVVGSD